MANKIKGLSYVEAMRKLKLTYAELKELIDAGTIISYKVGRRQYVSLESIVAYTTTIARYQENFA